MTQTAKPICAILAGGASRRMGGGDKALLPLGGQSLLSRVLDRLRPQAAKIALNANGDAARFARIDLQILPDLPEFAGLGPLAGIIAAMDWAQTEGAATVATVAGDLPFLPDDLLVRFAGAGAPCFAGFGGGDPRPHPTCGLWPVSLRDDLARMLRAGERRMMAFARKADASMVVWDGPFDPFTNLNTPEDFAQAERMLDDV